MPPVRLVASVIVLLLALAAPLALAAAPDPMTVSGTLVVNGAAPRAGTPITARVAGSTDLALATIGEDGAFTLVVPADDPTTSGREGALEGEPLEFHALGGRALAPVAFASGAQRGNVSLALSLPDLAIVGAAAEPREVDEGENVTVSGAVANRGRVVATLVRLAVSDGATTLATQFLGDVPPNGTVGFSVVVGTVGLDGERSLRVQVLSGNGDADPITDVGAAGIVVDANEAPLVRDLRRVPVAPGPNETVALLLEAEDEDGIARVEFVWGVGTQTERVLVSAAPWQASIGAFPAGASVRYWAVVTDASPLERATTTPVQAFDVRETGEGSATPTPTASAPTTTPSASATPSPGAEDARGEPWPWVGGLAALMVVAYARRRST